MKRILLTLAMIATWTCYGYSQDCSAVVNDEAGIIKDKSAIQKALRPLIDEGADAKVVTVSSMSDTHVDNPSLAGLAAVESYYEKSCPSWRSGNVRKANLFVIIVAPSDRKKNIFFGSSYMPALPRPDDVDTIFSRAANPLFRQGLWGEGIAAAAKDFSARITAYHDQRQHPAVSTTTNNYDFSFLKTFAWIFFGSIGLFLLVWLIYSVFSKRRRERDEVASAQAQALDEWNRTNETYLRMPKDNPRYSDISQQFADMSNKVKYDPNSQMTKADYLAAGSAWRDLRSAITSATAQTIGGKNPAGWSEDRQSQQAKRETKHSHSKHSSPPPVQAPTAATSSPREVVRETTVIHDNGNDFTTGLILGDMMGSRRDPEPEPERHRYREPEPEPEPERSSGSDSSWGSPESLDPHDESLPPPPESLDDGDSSGGGGGSDSSW